MNTPILLIIFNREDTLRRVFDRIREMQPAQLFISADGPREGVAGDLEKCLKAREVVQNVDWPCDVKVRFLDQNLGCGLGPSSAISWFFEHVDQGIILEDDCVPHPTFFKFAEQLLEYYVNCNEVMHIGGTNFLDGEIRGSASYYCSKWSYVWGWATWKRAWKFFDYELLSEPYRSHIWDAQWKLSIEKNRGVAIVPNVNLVSNIGSAHPLATHDTPDSTRYSRLSTYPIDFPLTHPKTLKKSDRYLDYSVLRNENGFYELVIQKPVILMRDALLQLFYYLKTARLKFLKFFNR